MANRLLPAFRHAFLKLCEKKLTSQCRTFDQIYNDAGYRTTEELATAISQTNSEDLHATYTTLRHWANGRSVIRLNIIGLIQLCRLLKTDPVELAVASKTARRKFRQRKTA